MITDKLTNAKIYYNLSSRIAAGLKYIQDTDFSTIVPGRYDIDGENLFALVSEYKTKSLDEAKTENHKSYIDIQYIVKGSEHIGYAVYKAQKPSQVYNPEKDVAFYNCQTVLIKYEEGDFAIFFPDDLHQPGIGINGPEEVKKVVIKVKID